MPQRSSKLIAVPLGLTGILLGSACMADWLTDPLVSGLLWPVDINAWLIEILGGEAGGQGKPPELSPTSVAARLLAILALTLGAGRLFNRREPFGETMTASLMRLGITGFAAGLVWSIQQFVTSQFALAMLPSLLMLLAGVTLYSFVVTGFGQPASREPENSSTRAAWTLLLLVTIIWIGISFLLNERLYANLLIPHGDSAMYEEHLWNVWHGKGFRSYLDQGLFLGEHIQVIHLLLLPLHLIWPSHLALELAESVALGSCTIPLFLIVRRRTGDAWAACLLGISWLFFCPMHFLDIAIDQKSFRPICLGLPFLFWMVHCAESGRFRLAWLFLLIALSAKEDMALITAPISAILAIDAWRSGPDARPLFRWAIAAAIVSAAWLLLSVLVVIPAFRSGDVVHYSRYFGELGSSPGELIRTALTRPDLVLARIVSFRTLFYAGVFLAPLAFVAVRSPLKLSAGILTFTMLSLLELGNGAEGSELPPVPYHHFHAPLLPVLFWAAGCALAAWRIRPAGGAVTPASSRSAALLILCCCLTTGFSSSLSPLGASYWSDVSGFGRHALFFPKADDPAGARLLHRAAMADRVVELIPRNARVASTDFIHTRLTHCERSYDYSDYTRVVNEAGRRVPADTEYIVIDTGHRYSTIRRPEDVPELQEPSDWTLLPDTTDGHFLILQRTPTDTAEDD